MWITFLINCYKKIMNAVLVLLWIIAPVVGGVKGGLVGVLCGLAAVLVFEFLVMPPVFVLFEINENQKEMKKANSSEPAPGGEVWNAESGSDLRAFTSRWASACRFFLQPTKVGEKNNRLHERKNFPLGKFESECKSHRLS